MDINAADIPTMIASGENLEVEFKRGGPNDRDLVEAVVCMANGPGGTLLVGVEDDGRVTGHSARHGGVIDPVLVQVLIANRTMPPLMTEVDVIDIEGVTVMAVSVPSVASPIGAKDGVYKRRALRFDGKPECIPYTPHEMFSAYFNAKGIDYAEVVAPQASLADLDRLELERLRQLASRVGVDPLLAQLSDEELLRACGATRLQEGHTVVTFGGILLFGTEQAIRHYVPTAEVALQVLDGTKVVINDIGYLPLLRAIESLTERVLTYNRETELMWRGLYRVGANRLPPVAVREAIANALVHRDYTQQGMVQVLLDEQTLRVASPGGFPRGVTTANLLEVTEPRSRTLADVFKRARVVERTGRGVALMTEAMIRNGHAVPDYETSNSYGVVVKLEVGEPDMRLVKAVLAAEDADRDHRLTLVDLRVVQLLNARQRDGMTAEDIAAGMAHSSDHMASVLEGLSDRKIVEVFDRGSRRKPHYRLAAGTVAAKNAVGDPSQLIVEFARDNSRITRAEAAEFTGLHPEQAGALLRRLVAEGALEQRGEKRGTHYVVTE